MRARCRWAWHEAFVRLHIRALTFVEWANIAERFGDMEKAKHYDTLARKCFAKACWLHYKAYWQDRLL